MAGTRRRLLRTLAAGVVAGTAGCVDRFDIDSRVDWDGSSGQEPTTTATPPSGSRETDGLSGSTETDGPSQASGFPMYCANGARTGAVSDATVPTGDVGWTAATSDEVRTVPAVVDGSVYVGSGSSVYAFGASEGSDRWEVDAGGQVASPAAVGDAVYVPTADERLLALAVADGSERWEAPIAAASAASISNDRQGRHRRGRLAADAGSALQIESRTRPSPPAVVDGTVYVTGGDGLVVALAVDDGTRRWSFATAGDEAARLDAAVWVQGSAATQVERRVAHPAPAVAGDIVVAVNTDGRLYALDRADGTERWSVDVPGRVVATPTLADGLVVVGSTSGVVLGVDRTDGTERWRFSVEGAVEWSPSIAHGVVCVGASDGTVHGASTIDGDVSWSRPIGSAVSGPPAIADDAAIVGDGDGVVRALALEDGQERSAVDVDASVTGGCAVADGGYYVGTADGTVYAVR